MFTALWVAWVVMFIVVEALALFKYQDQPGHPHTLSAQVWWLVRGAGPGHWLARLVVVVGLAWLVGHFLA